MVSVLHGKVFADKLVDPFFRVFGGGVIGLDRHARSSARLAVVLISLYGTLTPLMW